MKLVKCPKCELNYLRPEEEYCEVCLKDMKKGKAAEEPETYICPECGENMVAAGQELCLACLKEKRKLDKAERLEQASPTSIEENVVEIDSIVNNADMPDEEIADEPVDTVDDDDIEEDELAIELDEAEAF